VTVTDSVEAAHRGKPDTVCAAAVDLAREVLSEASGEPEHVGEWLGVVAAGERSAVHLFACSHPGYAGWHWSVAVSRVVRARSATVDELWLEPGDGALLAPPWRPWAERVAPGDLGVGDVFPTAPDDTRLAPGYTGADDLAGDGADDPLRPTQWELGLGRVRVLSAVGREEASDRWVAGETGPQAAMAKAAPARCSSCGWLLMIGGPLGQGFGLCANEMSPADGRAVSLQHGCGAHSEVDAEPAATVVVETVVDDLGFEPVDLATVPHDSAAEPVAAGTAAADVEADEADDAAAEPQVQPDEASGDGAGSAAAASDETESDDDAESDDAESDDADR
jgi:hypothetical protein